MTIRLSPPPLQVPPQFLQDKQTQGFFSGLLNTIYQLWTAVYSIRNDASVTTTDASTTAVMRIAVDNNTTMMIVANIVARRTGGSSGSVGDSAFYTLTGAYKNINGALTGIGTPALIGGEDQSAWNVGFTTDGVNAVVTVLGAAGNEIKWNATVSTYVVG